MLKKTLIAITVVALLAVTAQAFDGKIHWTYEQIPVVIEWVDGDAIPVEVAQYDVMFHIPHYAIIEPQDGEIELEQTVGMTFEGSLTFEAEANFDATLSCDLELTPNGELIQDDESKWSCDIDDGDLDMNVPEDQTITVTVDDADVMVGLDACSTYKVAECTVFIAPL